MPQKELVKTHNAKTKTRYCKNQVVSIKDVLNTCPLGCTLERSFDEFKVHCIRHRGYTRKRVKYVCVCVYRKRMEYYRVQYFSIVIIDVQNLESIL